jgi:hypothetical protein
MLRQSPPTRGHIQLVHQLIQQFEAQNTVIHRRLQKLGNILRELAMRGVIEPSQLGDTANELDERERDKVLQRRSVVGQIAQDVIANVDALGYGKVVPMRGDEFGEAVGCHEQRVLGVGAIEDVLTLGDE